MLLKTIKAIFSYLIKAAFCIPFDFSICFCLIMKAGKIKIRSNNSYDIIQLYKFKLGITTLY